MLEDTQISYLIRPSRSYHDSYEPEFVEEFEEPLDELLGDDEGDDYGGGEGREGRETGMQNGMNGHQDYVASGDPAAAAAAAAKSKDGKAFDKLAVPKDQRSTTPYMTKYEKARLLGTRALQIRYDVLLLQIIAAAALTVWKA